MMLKKLHSRSLHHRAHLPQLPQNTVKGEANSDTCTDSELSVSSHQIASLIKALNGLDDESLRSVKSSATAATNEESVNDDSLEFREPRARKVSFKSVCVREYERDIGDNPSCSAGAPITIGWRHSEERELDMDEYERLRGSLRSCTELMLTRQARHDLLMEWGATSSEIHNAIRAKMRTKAQRQRTIASSGNLDVVEAFFERASRKVKTALKMRRSTKDLIKELMGESDSLADD